MRMGTPEIPDLDTNGLPEVDFSVQNIIGGVTLLALVLLIYQLYRATKRTSAFSKWQMSICFSLLQ